MDFCCLNPFAAGDEPRCLYQPIWDFFKKWLCCGCRIGGINNEHEHQQPGPSQMADPRHSLLRKPENLTRATMDLSQLHNALYFGSFDKVADICDELILQVASTGIAYQEEWPYAIHLLGHLYVHDLDSARFLWKSVPQGIKESRPELLAAWKIGQCLWTKDYAGVFNSVRGFHWSPEASGIVASFLENYTRKMFVLLTRAYSTITVTNTAKFLGMTEEDATKYVVEHGWILDAPSKMLTIVKPKTATDQKADPSKLERLTEFVFHLENDLAVLLALDFLFFFLRVS